MPLTPTRIETAANWASSNPVLANNEVGIESDTGIVKVGDGVRAWVPLNVTENQQTSSQKALSTSDETGTGAQVYATSPTLVTPVLGVATATSVNGSTIPTSKTIVVTTDKLSVHAATTSAELAGVISDETGTGALVFGTSPVLTTPKITGVIGAGGAAPTIASAATIAPTTAITFVSGVTGIDTITAPAPIATQGGSIVIIPTGIFITSLAGNIALSSTSVANRALRMTYDPTTTKWYPSY